MHHLNYRLAGVAVTSTAAELNYVDGVTSAIQTQLNGKQATITGAATTITTANLTASRALVSDSSGKVAVSAVTSTEVGYLDGVTSAIQTQLDSKPAAYAASVTTSSGTATIAHSAHGLAFPVNVQVYDENGQLVLVDIRQTVAGGEMTITINAPDATYDVIAVGCKGFVS
jgi:fructose-specific component phosphotransferase system IIB-like protein